MAVMNEGKHTPNLTFKLQAKIFTVKHVTSPQTGKIIYLLCKFKQSNIHTRKLTNWKNPTYTHTNTHIYILYIYTWFHTNSVTLNQSNIHTRKLINWKNYICTHIYTYTHIHRHAHAFTQTFKHSNIHTLEL